eukprot:scaffold113518_cov20-Tisochrysis_lutea.AAC.1
MMWPAQWACRLDLWAGMRPPAKAPSTPAAKLCAKWGCTTTTSRWRHHKTGALWLLVSLGKQCLDAFMYFTSFMSGVLGVSCQCACCVNH